MNRSTEMSSLGRRVRATGASPPAEQSAGTKDQTWRLTRVDFEPADGRGYQKAIHRQRHDSGFGERRRVRNESLQTRCARIRRGTLHRDLQKPDAGINRRFELNCEFRMCRHQSSRKGRQTRSKFWKPGITRTLRTRKHFSAQRLMIFGRRPKASLEKARKVRSGMSPSSCGPTQGPKILQALE